MNYQHSAIVSEGMVQGHQNPVTPCVDGLLELVFHEMTLDTDCEAFPDCLASKENNGHMMTW